MKFIKWINKKQADNYIDNKMSKNEAKECHPNLYNLGKKGLINMILEYYTTMDVELIYSKEELEQFDGDELIIELGYGISSNIEVIK